jgi:hypothetical protein
MLTRLLNSGERIMNRLFIAVLTTLLVALAGCLGGEYRCRRLTAARSASYWPIVTHWPARRSSTQRPKTLGRW